MPGGVSVINSLGSVSATVWRTDSGVGVWLGVTVWLGTTVRFGMTVRLVVIFRLVVTVQLAKCRNSLFLESNALWQRRQV